VPADSLVALGLIAVLAALAVASLADARPADSARVAREGGTAFLPAALMHRAYALAAPLVALCVRVRVGADSLSWLSLALGLAAGLALGLGRPGTAAVLLALSGLGDLLDGAVARATGTASPQGAALDSALDRYVEFALHAGLLAAFRAHLALQLLVLASLFGSMLVTYSTAKAEALRVAPPRGWMKRAERLVWLGAGLVAAALAPLARINAALPLAAAVAVIAVFANLSAALRLHALARTAAGAQDTR
jgi:CDP-diacylglycerol--glycerol-3-phosphate 3-phosphatidyltransferase